MKSIIVGTAGHIDHGKTALVRALTGIDADRLPEEKRRGITIDIGFADLDLGDVRIGFVDVPGHERFVKNMLAGAHGIDLVALVIAADESVMPQTREHFDICRLLGVKHGLVVITKSDLVDEEFFESEAVPRVFIDRIPREAVFSVAVGLCGRQSAGPLETAARRMTGRRQSIRRRLRPPAVCRRWSKRRTPAGRCHRCATGARRAAASRQT